MTAARPSRLTPLRRTNRQDAHASFGDLAERALLFGVGGYVLENMLFGERKSAVFGGRDIPFLPVYAVGGSLVTVLGPSLKAAGLPSWWRAVVYAVSLSGIEWVGCKIDRDLGACSWDYSGRSCAAVGEGCVDAAHAVMWGALGLLAERLA